MVGRCFISGRQRCTVGRLEGALSKRRELMGTEVSRIERYTQGIPIKVE